MFLISFKNVDIYIDSINFFLTINEASFLFPLYYFFIPVVSLNSFQTALSCIPQSHGKLSSSLPLFMLSFLLEMFSIYLLPVFSLLNVLLSKLISSMTSFIIFFLTDSFSFVFLCIFLYLFYL